MGSAVVVEGLRKSYGAHVAVHDVSFEVAEGEIVVTHFMDEADWITRIPGVLEIDLQAGEIAVTGNGPILARIAHGLVERGVEPSDLRVDRSVRSPARSAG